MNEQKEEGLLIKGDRPEGVRIVTCPHCNEELVIHLNTSIAKVEKFLGYGADNEDRWKANLSPDHAELLEWAKRSGLMNSFEAALRAGLNVPKHIDKYFLTWLRLTKPSVIPQWALDEFRGLFPGKFIEFHAAHTVGCVIASGEIQLFLPLTLIRGKSLRTGVNGNRAMIEADVIGVRQWIKTRNGYVPADCRAMLKTMHTRSIGEFARPAL